METCVVTLHHSSDMTHSVFTASTAVAGLFHDYNSVHYTHCVVLIVHLTILHLPEMTFLFFDHLFF